jgi:putative transposase
VIDEFMRECLATDVAGRSRSGRVIEVLAQLVSVQGRPRYLRSDDGSEFCRAGDSRMAADGADRNGIDWPRQAGQKSAAESFNGKFRDQHLSLQCFRNRADGGEHRAAAEPLRRSPAAFESRVLDAGRLQDETSGRR